MRSEEGQNLIWRYGGICLSSAQICLSWQVFARIHSASVQVEIREDTSHRVKRCNEQLDGSARWWAFENNRNETPTQDLWAHKRKSDSSDLLDQFRKNWVTYHEHEET